MGVSYSGFVLKMNMKLFMKSNVHTVFTWLNVAATISLSSKIDAATI